MDDDYAYGEPRTKQYRRAPLSSLETPADYFLTSTTPSKVIHVSEVPNRTQDPDLLEAFGRFGKVAYVVVKKSNRNIALVEFEGMDGAGSAMLYIQSNPMHVSNQAVNLQYSAMQMIPRYGFESEQPNRVLVVVVTNVQFGVNASTIYDICKPHGNVLRIAIVKRSPNITALVELESIEQARSCKHAINGADIYTNCCTLKVEFAKIANVVVRFPDEDHVDFTLPAPAEGNRRTLMSSPEVPAPPSYPPAPRYDDPRDRPRDPYAPRVGYDPRESLPYGYGDDRRDTYRDRFDSRYDDPRRGRSPSRFDDRRDPRYDVRYDRRDERRDDRYDMGRDLRYDMRGRDPRDRYDGPTRRVSDLLTGGPGCVLIVGGVDQTKLTCDRLFNLLCLYGNVLRIMFMRKKTELALVEMGTPWQAKDVVHNVKRIDFLGMKLEISHSNQNCVNTVNDPFNLPDGSISFMDFTDNRLNRYITREHADKNRPCAPQKTLHWFNAPVDITEDKIRNIFTSHGAVEPLTITHHRLATGRSSAGTVEFSSVNDATEALILANHAPIEAPNTATPYIVKLAYTKARGHNEPRGNNFDRGDRGHNEQKEERPDNSRDQ